MTNKNLVERLRERATGRHPEAPDHQVMREAAALIEQQEALLADLEAKVDAQKALLGDLADALGDLCEMYVDMCKDSTAYADWDGNKEFHVIASRGLILAAKTHLET